MNQNIPEHRRSPKLANARIPRPSALANGRAVKLSHIKLRAVGTLLEGAMGFDRFARPAGLVRRARVNGHRPMDNQARKSKAILRCNVSFGVPEASTLPIHGAERGGLLLQRDFPCRIRRVVLSSFDPREPGRQIRRQEQTNKTPMVLTRQIWQCSLGLPQEGGIKNNRTALDKDPRCGHRE
jgi:hypothetical protein